MIKVEGHPHLYRDEKTGAIINCDDIGYEQYVKSLKIVNICTLLTLFLMLKRPLSL